MEHDPGRLLLDALISNPAEGSAALLKNSKVVKPRPLAEWMRANDAHAVIWHPLQNKFFLLPSFTWKLPSLSCRKTSESTCSNKCHRATKMCWTIAT